MRSNKFLFLFSLIFVFIINPGFSANRFWIASTLSNWNNTANWSTISGGVGGASVPGALDLAIFDALGTGNCNINASVNVLGFSISSYPGVIFQNANTISIGSSGFIQNSGIFTGGNANISIVSGNFNLNGGAFIATSANFSIGGSVFSNQTIFNHQAGTFSHNNGLVTFDAGANSCTQYTYLIDVLATTLFYDVDLNSYIFGCGVNHIFNTPSGDVVTAVHNLTHSDGIINGLFSLDNNLTINAGADGGTGTITFDGTGAQTYFQAAGSQRTCKIVVNKPSGAVTPAVGNVDLTVQGYNQILGDFTCPTGNFSIGGSLFGSQNLFQHQAGTFSHNNGLVTFDAGANVCAQYTYLIDVLPSTLFYDVQVNSFIFGCGFIHIISTAPGDVVTAVHNLTHSDGIINGLFSLDNNLTINAGADGGTGTITFDGTGAQTYFQAAGSQRTCKIVVNKPSGAVTPAVGNVDLTVQGYNQILGDFTCPTGNFSIGGSLFGSQNLFQHQAGTFSHNNGLVTFDAGANVCAQYTYLIDVLPSTLFYDVQVNSFIFGCGFIHIISTAPGDVVTAVHNLTHSDGIINGLFSLDNNLTINAGADGGTGTITFDGTGAQTYFQAAGSQRTCKIVVNKPSGAVTPAVGNVDLTVQGYNQILGDFTCPTGNFSIGGSLFGSQNLFQHQAGTFSHNNGLVTFDAGANVCAQYTYLIDVLPSTLFYDVQVNSFIFGCGFIHIISTAPGDVVTAVHNLTHSDGIINGLFSLDNNLTINAGADGGTGTITFDGTGAQTYFQAAGSQRTCKIAVNKPSGAVTPAVGNVDLTVQGYDQILGDFTCPTGTFRIGGSLFASQNLFQHQAGTFSHNNGLVTFDAGANSCTQYTYLIDVLASTLFYDVELNSSIFGCGVTHIFTSNISDSINVKNNLKYTDGICNAHFEAEGNVTVTPTFDGGSGRLIFSGSSNQTFDLTGATSLFDGPIVFNKSNTFSVTLLSNCILDAGASQPVTFNKGICVSTAVNLLSIGHLNTVLNANDSSYVRGPLRKIGSQVFTFPVGKEVANGKKYYRPIAISRPNVSTDHFTAEYFPVDPDPTYTTTAKDITLHHISRREYWIVDRTNGVSNVSVTPSWRDSTSGGVTVLADLRVARWDGSMWKDHGSGGVGGTINSGTVITSGVVTAFSPFTLASITQNNPLPIELISFSGKCSSDSVQLNWTTASQTNNNYFTLQTSIDGVKWSDVAKIVGAGNSSTNLTYRYSIKNNFDFLSYFRLKQTDYDGEFNYSQIITVACEIRETELSIYPNPAKDYIIISTPYVGNLKIDIINALGQTLKSEMVYKEKTNDDNVIINIASLPFGIYLIRFGDGKVTYTKHFIKEN